MVSPHTRGLFAGLAAFISWGLVPLYWRQLREVPAFEILAHRAIWLLIFVGILLSFHRQWSGILQTRRGYAITTLRGILISINWVIFIWAVNAGHIVETSMGYFITPLLNLVVGMLVFREKLRRPQWLAVFLAAIGVVVATTEAHHGFPWIAVGLALSFSTYGALKKVAQIAPMPGLFLETAVMTPLAIAYLWLLPARVPLTPLFSHNPLFLIGGGIITAFPLLWFGYAARELKLTTISFLQFIAPSISFLIGVLVYRENFSSVRLLAFSFIWAGVIVFSLEAWIRSREAEVPDAGRASPLAME